MNVTKYREYRRQGVTATLAAVWARTPELSEQFPGVTWGGGWYTGGDYTLPNGWLVTIELEGDDDNEPDGKFTDRWEEGAIQHPEWRPGAWNMTRWYLPLNAVTDHRLALRRLGYARHEAWVLGVRYAREECLRNVETSRHYIRVTVSDAEGSFLGMASLGAIDAEDDTNGREYLQDLTRGLIEEAMPEDAPDFRALATAS